MNRFKCLQICKNIIWFSGLIFRDKLFSEEQQYLTEVEMYRRIFAYCCIFSTNINIASILFALFFRRWLFLKAIGVLKISLHVSYCAGLSNIFAESVLWRYCFYVFYKYRALDILLAEKTTVQQRSSFWSYFLRYIQPTYSLCWGSLHMLLKGDYKIHIRKNFEAFDRCISLFTWRCFQWSHICLTVAKFGDIFDTGIPYGTQRLDY